MASHHARSDDFDVVEEEDACRPNLGNARAGAGTAIIHHGDIKHAGDTVEGLQLVAFFYGRERRGNALPLASDRSQTDSAPPTARHASRAPPPMPASAATSKGLLTDIVLREPQRLITLKDVAGMIPR